MNLNKIMQHFGLAGTGVIVLLLMIVVYYLYLIEQNTSLEAFSVGAGDILCRDGWANHPGGPHTDGEPAHPARPCG